MALFQKSGFRVVGRPQALILGRDNDGLHQRRANSRPPRRRGNVDADLGNTGVDAATRNGRERGPSCNVTV